MHSVTREQNLWWCQNINFCTIQCTSGSVTVSQENRIYGGVKIKICCTIYVLPVVSVSQFCLILVPQRGSATRKWVIVLYFFFSFANFYLRTSDSFILFSLHFCLILSSWLLSISGFFSIRRTEVRCQLPN